jgi:hypothetical protein
MSMCDTLSGLYITQNFQCMWDFTLVALSIGKKCSFQCSGNRFHLKSHAVFSKVHFCMYSIWGEGNDTNETNGIEK